MIPNPFLDNHIGGYTTMKAARIIAMSLLVLLVGGGAFVLSQPGGWKAVFSVPLDRAEALSALRGLTPNINRLNAPVTRRAKVKLGIKADLASTLPDIGIFAMSVSGRASDIPVELFVSTEKSGKGTDGWLNEVANAFNASNPKLPDGRSVSVSVRKIASGTGYQFIASGKHRPTGFSPSNHLWVEMAKAHGVVLTRVSERMVGNIAGVVMRQEAAAAIRERYGQLDVRSILDAVVQGTLVMGYTNPFASSTGLNFLVTVLSDFASGNSNAMLSEAVVSSFESFQRGVPFVALTTLQMRESVQSEGSLDAFVMEYQTFAATPELASGYEFIPFGIRHDNPLYMVGDDPAQLAALKLFAAFSERAEFQAKATQYGFNSGPGHKSAYTVPDGQVLVQAQQLWKEKKDAGRPIVAVFLCDVSGSMRGS
ncbi:MAG: solute-binding protein, partial [Chromatiales bacterium]|nr:solute-binding protein [Chromatiales bacterium]